MHHDKDSNQMVKIQRFLPWMSRLIVPVELERWSMDASIWNWTAWYVVTTLASWRHDVLQQAIWSASRLLHILLSSDTKFLEAFHIKCLQQISRNEFIWLAKQYEVENAHITTKTSIPIKTSKLGIKVLVVIYEFSTLFAADAQCTRYQHICNIEFLLCATISALTEQILISALSLSVTSLVLPTSSPPPSNRHNHWS